MKFYKINIPKNWRSLLMVLGIFLFLGCASNTNSIEIQVDEQQPVSTLNATEPASLPTKIASVTPTDILLTEDISPTHTPPPEFSYDKSVLTQKQRENLTSVSQNFLANSENAANEIAKNLSFILNDGHSSNMCGPLAIAQLRDAGLLNQNVSLSDFWLLSPNQQHASLLLQNVFPISDYQWIKDDTPINKINFLENPLYTGDFVYLFAGDGGTFEHILTVSRVDEEGRAYAVTNTYTGIEYLIEEEMLYDPNLPGEGLFYEFTDIANWQIGLTGYGGIQIWRPLSPIADLESNTLTFWNGMKDILSHEEVTWQVIIKEVGGETIFSQNAYKIVHPASTIKIPLAILFINILEDLGVEDIANYLDSHSVEGRSLEQLLHAMIVDSEEDATITIYLWVEENISIPEKLNDLGYSQTSIEPRYSSVHEITKFFEDLYLENNISSEGREIILTLMAEFSENDAIRLGEFMPKMAEGSILYNKRGSLIDTQTIVADIGILETENGVYLISFIGVSELGSRNYDDMGEVISASVDYIWQFLFGN